jgi:hypothetical protein
MKIKVNNKEALALGVFLVCLSVAIFLFKDSTKDDNKKLHEGANAIRAMVWCLKENITVMDSSQCLQCAEKYRESMNLTDFEVVCPVDQYGR